MQRCCHCPTVTHPLHWHLCATCPGPSVRTLKNQRDRTSSLLGAVGGAGLSGQGVPLTLPASSASHERPLGAPSAHLLRWCQCGSHCRDGKDTELLGTLPPQEAAAVVPCVPSYCLKAERGRGPLVTARRQARPGTGSGRTVTVGIREGGAGGEAVHTGAALICGGSVTLTSSRAAERASSCPDSQPDSLLGVTALKGVHHS